MAGTFIAYDLRTTDLDAAEAFYARVLEWQVRRAGEARVLHSGEERIGQLVPLPERARALGAPAHWLGHVGVEDVEAAVHGLVARGGQPLGPPQGATVTLRDAQGAVLAVTPREGRSGVSAVGWHELHTTDHLQAWATYSALFGWQATEVLELPPPVGTYQQFSWEGAGRSVGAMASTARTPTIHTHWLFYFAVENLDAALARVRALGGRVLSGPLQVPGGGRVAQCEDPQGAAFALRQRLTATR